MRAKIIPSAPLANYEAIEELAMKCKGELKRIQIDMCDGKFVPSISWPFTEYTKTDFTALGEKPDFDVYLPFWESVNYSADMMVENPLQYLQTIVAYGIDEILIHFRSLGTNPEEQFSKIIEKAKFYELNLILAVDVKTDLDEFLSFAKKYSADLNGFQVMGIEKIGFQKQSLDQKSLEIVKTLKKTFGDLEVYFDGAINEETAQVIKDSGVDVFCVGSYLTSADNFVDNLQELKSLLK